MNFLKILKILFGKPVNPPAGAIELEILVKNNLLTMEEVLRIKKDRAIVLWEEEKERLKSKVKKSGS